MLAFLGFTGKRWDELVLKYGQIRAMKPFLFGEKPPELQETEDRLAPYIVFLLVMSSAAAAVVTGSVELIAIGNGIKVHDWFEVGIAGLMLGILIYLVWSMDLTTTKTLPRISIYFQRNEKALAWLSVLYVAAVCAIEALTMTLLIMNEYRISDIIKGKPIIEAGTLLFGFMAGYRGLMLVATIIQGHFVNGKLPVQLSTAKRKGAELFGGQLMDRIAALKDKKHLRLGKLLENLVLFMQPDPEVNTRGLKGIDRWRAKYNALKEHYAELVKALDALERAPELSTQDDASENLVKSPVQLAESPGGARAGENARLLATAASQDNTPGSLSPNDWGDQSPNRDRGESSSHGFQSGVPDSANTGLGDSIDGNHAESPDRFARSGLVVLTGGAANIPSANDLQNTYVLPPTLSMYTKLTQQELPGVFGIAQSTFSRRVKDNQTPGINPERKPDGNGNLWQVWQILYLYEHGVFDGLDTQTIESYIAREVAANGHLG